MGPLQTDPLISTFIEPHKLEGPDRPDEPVLAMCRQSALVALLAEISQYSRLTPICPGNSFLALHAQVLVSEIDEG